MSINSLMISRILPQYTAEYIANVFWYQNIAQVSSITLFPYLQGSHVFQRAYVTIAAWSDSEVAYNLIQRLKDDTKKTRIVHHDDLWWPVQVNTDIAGYYYLAPYTTTFSDSYYFKPETLEDEERVIPAYRFGGNLTVTEAIERCTELQEAISDCDKCEGRPLNREILDALDYCKEVDYLEEQLRAYGNKRLASDERCIQYYGLPDKFMSVKDTNARLDFLKTILTKCSPTTSVSHWGVQVIKDEIEFLEDQLFSIVTLKSQNVTLRPHQQQLVV